MPHRVVIEVMAVLDGAVDRGTVLAWHGEVGDRVRRGDVLGEVETDKANVEVEAPEDGVIVAVLVPVRGEFAKGAPLVNMTPAELPTGPSDLVRRQRARRVALSGAARPVRCRFCQALATTERDCGRCGAPL